MQAMVQVVNPNFNSMDSGSPRGWKCGLLQTGGDWATLNTRTSPVLACRMNADKEPCHEPPWPLHPAKHDRVGLRPFDRVLRGVWVVVGRFAPASLTVLRVRDSAALREVSDSS